MVSEIHHLRKDRCRYHRCLPSAYKWQLNPPLGLCFSAPQTSSAISTWTNPDGARSVNGIRRRGKPPAALPSQKQHPQKLTLSPHKMAALRGEQPPTSNGPREPERTTGLAVVSLVLADWWTRPLKRSLHSPTGCRFPPLLPAGRSCWGATAPWGPRWRRAAAPSWAAPRRGPWSATVASCPRRTATRSKPLPPGRWPGTGVFSRFCCLCNSYPWPFLCGNVWRL